ncbi:hypothetical protein DFR67_102190 [Williamsia limnetica]|uniref:Uncharacterized protein n=1 Tax=Williamsia limnetica TaxID=882452 RepID=A0A318RSW9_WILLI|nr:hypothetical protein DFR67_102190 [Williamsia limnetica]
MFAQVFEKTYFTVLQHLSPRVALPAAVYQRRLTSPAMHENGTLNASFGTLEASFGTVDGPFGTVDGIEPLSGAGGEQ